MDQTAPAEEADVRRPNGWYRHYVLVVLTLVYTVSFIDRYVVAIVIEPIKDTFGISDAWLGVLSGLGFAIFYAGLGMPIALVADRTNRRNIIAMSTAIFSVATLACGLAVRFWQLLVARLVVGIGEAGTSPESHSIIADYYAPDERGFAMGVLATGLNLGLLVAYFAGGWITDTYGWRYTFMAAGAPGLLLTALVFATVREPERGRLEATRPAGRTQSAFQVIRYLRGTPTFVHIAAGGALSAFVGYGGSQWIAAFLSRAHDMSTSNIGFTIGLIYGVAGGLGTFAGGAVAGLLGRRDVRWYMWLPAGVIVVSTPFLLAFYLVGTTATALAVYVIPAAVGAIYVAPALAITQTLVPPNMRATTSAILLFVVNIIGLAMGPFAVGLASDFINPLIDVGGLTGDDAAAFASSEGLRWALVVCSLVHLWSALHFHLASRSLKADLARVQER